MRSQPSTHLSIILHPSNEEHALYLLSEIPSCERFTVLDTTEDIRSSPIAEPFILTHKEKRLTLALPEALSCEAIKEIAQLVATGLLSGFIVQGEINLGEKIINNLYG